jgi:hypothetical protein
MMLRIYAFEDMRYYVCSFEGSVTTAVPVTVLSPWGFSTQISSLA